MKKLKFIFLLLFTNYSLLIAQTGWFLQTSPTTKNLHDIFFINSQTGWACGDSGRIIKTTNGGTTWTLKTTPTNLTLRAIRFSDSNYGYAVGGDDDQNPFCQDLNVILKTTNGGENWIFPPTLTNPGDIYYDIAILNKDTAFITYAGSDLSCYNTSGGSYRTFNGGINWTQFGGGGHMKGISFINSCTGWTAIYAASASPMIETYYFYKTTNTGLNWTLIYSDSTMDWHTGKIRFVDENTGYCYKKILRKTTNSGYNWQSIDSVTTSNIGSYSLANKDTLWIAKGFYIFRTNNSGVNWTQQLTVGVPLNSIYFLDKNTGWIAGNSGIIFKTVTGGVGNEDYAAYFPMHTGDFYVYYAWYWPYPNNGSRFKARITKDTIMNGHKYFYLTNFPDIGTGW